MVGGESQSTPKVSGQSVFPSHWSAEDGQAMMLATVADFIPAPDSQPSRAIGPVAADRDRWLQRRSGVSQMVHCLVDSALRGVVDHLEALAKRSSSGCSSGTQRRSHMETHSGSAL